MAIKRIEKDEEFAVEYPRVRGWLNEAIARSSNPNGERDILAGLIEDRLCLWVGDECAAITDVNGGVKTGHGAEQKSATAAPA